MSVNIHISLKDIPNTFKRMVQREMSETNSVSDKLTFFLSKMEAEFSGNYANLISRIQSYWEEYGKLIVPVGLGQIKEGSEYLKQGYDYFFTDWLTYIVFDSKNIGISKEVYDNSELFVETTFCAATGRYDTSSGTSTIDDGGDFLNKVVGELKIKDLIVWFNCLNIDTLYKDYKSSHMTSIAKSEELLELEVQIKWVKYLTKIAKEAYLDRNGNPEQ